MKKCLWEISNSLSATEELKRISLVGEKFRQSFVFGNLYSKYVCFISDWLWTFYFVFPTLTFTFWQYFL